MTPESYAALAIIVMTLLIGLLVASSSSGKGCGGGPCNLK